MFQTIGHSYEIGQGIRLHFLHNAATVNLNCRLAKLKFPGDLLVRQSFRDQVHDFDFASGEFRKALVGLRFPPVRARVRCLSATHGSRGEQVLLLKGLVRNSTAPALTARIAVGTSP